jgi:hypothetical protein
MLGFRADEGIVLEKSTSLLEPLLAKPGVSPKARAIRAGEKELLH